MTTKQKTVKNCKDTLRDDPVLAQILSECNDNYVIGWCLSKRNQVKLHIKCLKEIENKFFQQHVFLLVREKDINSIIDRYNAGKLPEIVYTHLRRSVSSLFAEFIKESKMKN